MAVWSFHKTNMALGFSVNPFSMDRGVPFLSTAIGVDPVVSTDMATIFAATDLGAFFNAPLIDFSNPSR